MVKIDLSTLKAEQTKSFSNCILDREEMDYNKYYDQQTKGLTGYHGAVFQNGSGLGSMFTRLFRWAMPIIQQAAAPAISTLKSSVSDGFHNFSEDLENDKTSIKESAKKRIMETFGDIKRKLQTGRGHKRLKRAKRQKSTFRTIFDNE